MIWITKNGIVEDGKLITRTVSEASMKESMDKIVADNEKFYRQSRRRLLITCTVYLAALIYIIYVLWEVCS